MRVKIGNRKMRILLWIAVALILVLGLLILIHPFFVYVIPSIEHSGVELYTNGTYLKYDKGETFQKLVSELSFAEYGEVTSFTYHDSVLRDSWHSHIFPDAFILELDMGESYALAIQELQAKDGGGGSSGRDPSYGRTYNVSESGQGDYLFVIVFDQTQKVVCLLITDTDCWIRASDVWDQYFTIPGEPAPIPVEKS